MLGYICVLQVVKGPLLIHQPPELCACSLLLGTPSRSIYQRISFGAPHTSSYPNPFFIRRALALHDPIAILGYELGDKKPYYVKNQLVNIIPLNIDG
jgi:hypothetical protein